MAAAASLATLEIISEPGFHDGLNARAENFYRDMQKVLDRRGLPARVTGRASFWQFLFSDKDPRNQMDLLASDQTRCGNLDLALLKRGVYVLPNVRRFVSAVHTEQDFSDTLKILDAACADV